MDLVSEGVEATVSKEVRETVEAVRKLKKEYVTQQDLKEPLGGLDKSTISTRVNAAIDKGYLVNDEPRKGQPAKLKLGKSLPEEVEVLPRPESLFAS